MGHHEKLWLENFQCSIKIQPKIIDLSTRLWGITREFVGFLYQEPHAWV